MYNLLTVQSVLKNIGYVAIAVLILLVMITVHEAGHYFVGKLFKFKINEFAIGMGPAVFKKKLKSGEDFSIRALPLGGFCAFEGEDGGADDANSFDKKKPWQRILVLIAGAAMNYILSLLVIAITFGIYGQQVVGAQYIDNYYAAENPYSLESGDYILSITKDGKKTGIYMTTDFITALNHGKKGDKVVVEVAKKDGDKVSKNTTEKTVYLRNDVECKNMLEVYKAYSALGFGSAVAMKPTDSGKKIITSATYLFKIGATDDYKSAAFVNDTRQILDELKGKVAGDNVYFFISGGSARECKTVTLDDEWTSVNKDSIGEIENYFGVNFGEKEYYVTSSFARLGFFKVIGHSFVYSFKIAGTVFRSLGQLLTGKIGLNAVGGTITTIKTASQLISYGAFFALEITAFIGVNLAVFNLLPIPALDGARVVFCLIEWIFKKPVNRKVEAIIHTVGLILLLGFAILVDLLQFI